MKEGECWTPLMSRESGEPPEDGTTTRGSSVIFAYLRRITDVVAKVNPVRRTTFVRPFDFQLQDREQLFHLLFQSLGKSGA